MDTIELRWELMDNGRYAGYDDDTVIVWVYEEVPGGWCWEETTGDSDGWCESAERAKQDYERYHSMRYQPPTHEIDNDMMLLYDVFAMCREIYDWED